MRISQRWQRKASIVGRWLGRVVAALLLLAVLAAASILILLPRATQGSAMTVLTGSMTPEIPVGSVVLVRPVDPATLEVGDVATYVEKDDVFVTHRVHRINRKTKPTSYVFQGDANRTPDVDSVSADNIRGEVWFHVPYLGAIRDGLKGKGGVTLLAMLLLAGYAISQISAGLKQRRLDTGQSRELPVDRRFIAARFPRAATSDRAELLARWPPCSSTRTARPSPLCWRRTETTSTPCWPR